MRGHIRKRGKSSWSIVIDLAVGSDGKRRQKWITRKGTKKDAEKKLTEMLRELDGGTFVEPHKLRVGAYLDHWLTTCATQNAAPKTFFRYQDIVRDHLTPAFGTVELIKLHPMLIQDYYVRAQKEGRLDGKGGLAAETVHIHHRVLHAALKQALKWGLVAQNPCDAVELPKHERQEMTALTEDATTALLDFVKRTSARHYVPILIAVTTGVRRGELLGFKWDDVDFDAATIAVRRSVEQTQEGLRLKEPKTKRSRRTITLPALALEALRLHHTEQKKLRLRLGPIYLDNGLIFPKEEGSLWPPNSFSAQFSKLVRRAGLDRVRLHDLRHTHATILLGRGVNAKVVSERLGHSNVAFTLDVYGHVLTGMQEDAATKINEAFQGHKKNGR